MTHPLVDMLAHRPQQLVVHAQAYADLLSADAGLALRQAKRKAGLGMLTLAMAMVAMVLSGVAVMLWGVLPMDAMNWPWVMAACSYALCLALEALATLMGRQGQVRHSHWAHARGRVRRSAGVGPGQSGDRSGSVA